MDEKDIRKAANAEVIELKSIFEATQKEDIKRSCNVIFELYKGYVEAGFDKHQALALVIAFMQASLKNQNNTRSDA